MPKVKFSIIVPVYNAEEVIVRCVESLLGQNGPELEIILIDDGSEDGSYSVCERLRDCHREICLYQSTEKGVSQARNVGLAHASGDIIGFCDADDTYEPGALEPVERAFAENTDIDIVVGGYRVIYEKSGPTAEDIIVRKREARRTARELMEGILSDNRVLGAVWNKFFKASLLRNVLFDPALSLCEDMVFNMTVLRSNPACGALLLNRTVYRYYQSAGSVTNSVRQMFDRDGNIKYFAAIDALIEEHRPDRRIVSLARRKKFMMAVSMLLKFRPMPPASRRKLEKACAVNFPYFVLHFFSGSVKEDFERMLRLIHTGK